MAVLLLPFFQMRFPFVPRGKLHGVQAYVDFPALSMATWLNGKFQQQLNDWFEQNMGFRNYLVRIENQINFSLFNYLSTKSMHKIVLGENGYLFEKSDIDYWNGSELSDEKVEEIRVLVEKIKMLQTKLKERDITFFVLFSPSKAMIYPEFISQKYIHPLKPHRKTQFDIIRPMLKDAQVNYFDSIEYFREQKKTSRYPFYPLGGGHWNYYGACVINQELIRYIEKLSNKTLNKLTCEPVTTDLTAFGSDADLIRLLNIIDEDAFTGPIPYPTINSHPINNAHKPNILIVGTSFVWTLLSTMDDQNIYNSREFFYYFATRYNYSEMTAQAIDTKRLDWTAVFGHDVIILEVPPLETKSVGYTFIEKALEALEEETANLSKGTFQ